jgi:hypothetical protein
MAGACLSGMPMRRGRIDLVAWSCRFLPLAAALIAFGAAPRAVRAQAAAGPAELDENDTFSARPDSLVLVLGLGAPVGLVGVEYERALARTITVAGGAGVGASGGPQAALVVRLRRVDGPFARGLGVGGSYGDSDVPTIGIYNAIGQTGTNQLRDSVWLNGEIYLEQRFRDASLLRIAVGAGRAFHTGSCQHVPEEGSGFVPQPTECSDFAVRSIVPFVSFAAGQAF